MDTLPGPSPLVIADQPIPCARRGKDLAEALSQQSQCSGWDVSVLMRCCQVCWPTDLCVKIPDDRMSDAGSKMEMND